MVYEFQLSRKQHAFAAHNRLSSQNQGQFYALMDCFELIRSKMAAENPNCVILAEGFNYRSPQWWKNDTEHEKGQILNGLHRILF